MSSPFADWLERVLVHGESVQTAAPEPSADDRSRAVSILKAAHGRRTLALAGPALPFAPDAAWHAARLLAEACWKLVGESPAEPLPPIAAARAAAADHLAVDLTLRFLPTVQRRAASHGPSAALASELEGVLRRWPLSGALADLDGDPANAPEFEGHPGLQLLYAERIVRTARPGWIPAGGSAREWAERVFHERGRTLPAIPDPEGDRRD